ncbi:MAG: cysteine--tRNA ligase [Candidatus Omnitrophica bacterium]|nr:cysteine--tRNA ligase [Candidatus Omnitrophota bacterium]
MIQFQNTLSGKLEPFETLKPNEVTLYTCGPTVYHYAHIGNFRTFVFEDLLRRFLEFKGFKVRHVMNITDVDDKTIAGAVRDGKTLQAYTSFYTQAFLDDVKTLNMLLPTVQPCATEEIPSMIALIEGLVAKGIAYKADDGSVYYRVAEFPGYGKLSKKKLAGNISGARVDQDEYDKEEGADFVLWKAAKEGEPSWDSPWGKGRPGWHIECSAMCMRHLGETVDIHAGGEDLIFPHHENEIAQSEASTGKQFVKYWLHAKHLLVNGEKMSKSKGNFFTLRDLLEKGYDPMAIRYALLSVHYRNQLNFTFESLKEARDVIEKLDNCFAECLNIVNAGNVPKNFVENTDRNQFETYLKVRFDEMIMALDNDLNVSAAFASLFEALKRINAQIGLHQTAKMEKENAIRSAIDFFKKADRLLGLDIASVGSIPENVKTALDQYSEARKSRDFATSDLMRKKIVELGWLVKDGRPGEPSTVKKIRRAWDIKK